MTTRLNGKLAICLAFVLVCVFICVVYVRDFFMKKRSRLRQTFVLLTLFWMTLVSDIGAQEFIGIPQRNGNIIIIPLQTRPRRVLLPNRGMHAIPNRRPSIPHTKKKMGGRVNSHPFLVSPIKFIGSPFGPVGLIILTVVRTTRRRRPSTSRFSLVSGF